jgi:DNA-binding LacI/PurR family transcriptional regulator
VEELTEQKFALKVYHLSSDNSLDIAKQIISQRVVGVIFHAPLNSDFKIVQQAMKKNHIPCVTTNLTSKHVDLGVTTDDTQGVEDSVKHLAELGHQRILYFSYQDDEHSEYIQHREAGYIAGMKRYVGQSAVPRVESSPIGFFNNKKIIERVLSEPSDQRPTAVICINDAVALRVMQVAYQMGIKLPEELSVIGFADLEMAKYAIVPLTTIAQPFEEMGRKTAKSLLGIIKKHKTQSPGVKNKILPTKLIIRESTRAVVN